MNSKVYSPERFKLSDVTENGSNQHPMLPLLGIFNFRANKKQMG